MTDIVIRHDPAKDTATTVTLEWDAVQGAHGYVFLYGNGRSSSTLDGSRTSLRIAKTNLPVEVRAGRTLASGVYPPPVTPPPAASWDWTKATHRYYDFAPGTKVSGCKNRFSEGDHDDWWAPGLPEAPTPPYTLFSDNGGIHPFTDPIVGPGLKLRVTGDMGYWGTGAKGAYPYDSRTCSFKDISPTYIARGGVYRFEWAWRWLSANNPHGWPGSGTREGFITACNVGGNANVSHHCYLEGSGTAPYFRAGRNTAWNVWDFKYSNAAGIVFTPDVWHKMRFDLKVNTAGVPDGYMRYSTDQGGGWQEWARWDNIETYPSNFSLPYGVWWSLRLPNLDDGWAYNNEIDVAAARVTVNP